MHADDKNALWGWVAGIVIAVLVILFIFARPWPASGKAVTVPVTWGVIV